MKLADGRDDLRRARFAGLAGDASGMTLPAAIGRTIEAHVLGASPNAMFVGCERTAAGFGRVHFVAGGNDLFDARPARKW